MDRSTPRAQGRGRRAGMSGGQSHPVTPDADAPTDTARNAMVARPCFTRQVQTAEGAAEPVRGNGASPHAATPAMNAISMRTCIRRGRMLHSSWPVPYLSVRVHKVNTQRTNTLTSDVKLGRAKRLMKQTTFVMRVRSRPCRPSLASPSCGNRMLFNMMCIGGLVRGGGFHDRRRRSAPITK